MNKNRSLSIMVPALNEEDNIGPQVRAIHEAAKGRLDDYEVLVFDDGSTDRTPQVVDELARENEHVRVIHHDRPLGLGYCYREGQQLATKTYYMFIAGDNQFPADQIARMFDRVGEADIVVHNITNMHVRPLARQLVSRTFTTLVNRMFDLDVPYYNGGVIHRLDLLRMLTQNSDGFAYQAELMVRLLRTGATFVTANCEMVERTKGSSSAFKPKNVLSVMHTLVGLHWELNVKKRPATSLAVRLLLGKDTTKV